MSKAHVDPQALRQFSQDLIRFQKHVTELMQGMHSRMRTLESSWNDQEQRKFAEQFDQTTRDISRFMDHCQVYAKQLNRKAEHIENYLSGR